MNLVAPRRYSPDDLLRVPDGKFFELVDGKLVECRSSGVSSLVAGKVLREIGRFADAARLGCVFAAGCGYRCFPFDPALVRRPDGSFIQAGRISCEQMEAAYVTVVPDLAIEVVARGDSACGLNRKIEEYLRAGVRLVWIIDPLSRTVGVYRPQGSDSRLRDGDEVLAGR